MTEKPQLAMYLHPWDLVDEGVDTVFRRISSIGLNAVNLAVSYHSGRYILPHNPSKRIYSAEEGVVYFAPHQESYQKTVLKPRRSKKYADIDVLSLATDNAKRFGIAVNTWTVCLHNSAFTSKHPDLAVMNVYGGRDLNFLCPNNPNSQNYIGGLVRDLATNYDLNAIKLESASFPFGLEHWDHHEMFGTVVEPLASNLMTTCFCKHCVTKAKALGLDLQATRREILGIVEISLHTPPRILDKVPPEQLYRNLHQLYSDLPYLRELLEYKRAVVLEIYEKAADSLKDAKSKTKLGIITGGVLTGEDAEGIDLPSLARLVGGVDYIAYDRDPESVFYHIQWAKKRVGDLCDIYAGLRPNFPVAYDQGTLEGCIAIAKSAGADGLSFYNYGWTQLENFKWVKEGLKKAAWT